MWVRRDKVGEVSVRGRRSRCGGEKGGVNVPEVCEDMSMDKGGEKAGEREVINGRLNKGSSGAGGERNKTREMGKGRVRAGMSGEMAEGRMGRPGARRVGGDRVVCVQEGPRGGMARWLKGGPWGVGGAVVGKDEERAEVEVKCGVRAGTGVERARDGEVEGIKERVYRRESGGDVPVKGPAEVGEGGMGTGRVEMVGGARKVGGGGRGGGWEGAKGAEGHSGGSGRERGRTERVVPQSIRTMIAFVSAQEADVSEV